MNTLSNLTTHSAPTKPAKRPRDVRLDFFRGVCLVIIYIAHIWDNPWASYIPARFGFSDATEIFVFCSGMASAVAFGGTFAKQGHWIGTARILHRCWQVYWSHIGLFLVVIGFLAGVDRVFATGGSYIAGIGLASAVTAHAADALFGLMTLRFVPNFFDILPMYLIVLAMLPLVMLIAGQDRRVLTMVLALLWATAATGTLDLPALSWTPDDGSPAKTWFFNPFSWQILFFTGFAFMLGWLPPPPVSRLLLTASAAFVIISIPLAWWPGIEASPLLLSWTEAIAPLTSKTRFGLFRFLHFLSLAYLAYVAVGAGGSRLAGPIVDALCRLGQQSLAIFLSGMVLSFIASVALNLIGRSFLATAMINLGGVGILIVIARTVTWFKSSPWTRHTEAKAPTRVNRTATVSGDSVGPDPRENIGRGIVIAAE
jgi:hypothetical protein